MSYFSLEFALHVVVFSCFYVCQLKCKSILAVVRMHSMYESPWQRLYFGVFIFILYSFV